MIKIWNHIINIYYIHVLKIYLKGECIKFEVPNDSLIEMTSCFSEESRDLIIRDYLKDCPVSIDNLANYLYSHYHLKYDYIIVDDKSNINNMSIK